MHLDEWTVVHVRHKDAFERKLREIKEMSDRIVFDFDDRSLTAFVMDELNVPEMSGETLIVTLHTKDNVQRLIDLWGDFKRHPSLTVTFAHPGRNEQWSIRPALHDRIAGENFEQGLWSMASGVTHF